MKKAIALCFGMTIAVSFFFLGSIKSGSAVTDFLYNTPTVDAGGNLTSQANDIGGFVLVSTTTSATFNSIIVRGCRQGSSANSGGTIVAYLATSTNHTVGQYAFTIISQSENTHYTTDLPVGATAADCYAWGNDPLSSLTFEFPEKNLVEDQIYYILIKTTETTATIRMPMMGGTAGNEFDGLNDCSFSTYKCPSALTTSDSAWFWADYDPYADDDEVTIVPIDETPEYVEIMLDGGFQLNSKNCIIGETCQTKVYYGTEYDNGIFYLVNDAVGQRSREYAVASSSVGVKLVRSVLLDVPASASPGDVEYCVFGETSLGELELKCDLTITWLDEEGLDTAAFQECISTACDDVATTSAWWDVDFQGAIECGTRKTVCWLFTPSTSAKNKFQNTNEELKQNFPLSVGYQIKDVWASAGLQTASSATIALAPLKWWDPDTGTWKETGSNLLDNKTLQNGMGSDLYNTYYDWFERIIWLVFFIFLMNRVILLVNPSARSLFDLMPYRARARDQGTYIESANDSRVRHTEVVDLRRASPGGMTLDLRKKRY